MYSFQSPFTWRYGSETMRSIFSEEHKYKIWRTIWIALAKAQHDAGFVTEEELADLEQHKENIDIERIQEIEKETKHDVVAAIKEFAERAPKGAGKIHLGATSMDIVDNANMMRYQDAIRYIESQLVDSLAQFSKLIDQYDETPCMGYTHLQPAEPTTVGYRLAFYAQDLLTDYEYLQFVKQHMKGKGLKGAVGTKASYMALMDHDSDKVTKLEKQVMDQLGLNAQLISTQVYSRKTDYLILTALTSIASSLSKFAADLRILQSPHYGEWSEGFGKKQVGSSAMPFKKNPIKAEKICSLARYMSQLPNVAVENASHSYLERTLDDSANKRIIMPEAFLALDEILITTAKILDGLQINEKRITHNVAQFGPFAATEAILMQAVKKGASRQDLHEELREVALEAWEKVQNGEENPMSSLLKSNDEIRKYLTEEEIEKLLDVNTHIGDAPERARKLVERIQSIHL